MVAHASTSSTWEVEARVSLHEFKANLVYNSEFEDSLGYEILSQKQKLN